jgi:hypothetical protein
MAKQSALSRAARIFKATRGSLGRVIREIEITEEEAVAERRAARDIVVCDGSAVENRRLAWRIESTVGPCYREDPHRKAGPYALPHYQQESPPPEGHSFYETEHKKAARNP